MNPILLHICTAVHSVFGPILLICFWGALLSKKGSARHKAFGKRFAWSAGVILLFGIPLTIRVWERSGAQAGLLFASIQMIGVYSLSRALLAVKWKHESEKFFDCEYMTMLSYGLSFTGVPLAYMAIMSGDVVPALVGAYAEACSLRIILGKGDPTETKNASWWKYEHMAGMLTIGIFAHAGVVEIYQMIAKPLPGPVFSGALASLFLAVLVGIPYAKRKLFR